MEIINAIFNVALITWTVSVLAAVITITLVPFPKNIPEPLYSFLPRLIYISTPIVFITGLLKLFMGQ